MDPHARFAGVGGGEVDRRRRTRTWCSTRRTWRSSTHGTCVTIAPGSTRASFVFGANDSRLMDRYKNIYQIESARDGSYIKLELDVSALDGTPDGHREAPRLPRRVRAHRQPDEAVPHASTIASSVIDAAGKHREHTVEFHDQFGQITVTVDGSTTLTSPGAGSRGGRRHGTAGCAATDGPQPRAPPAAGGPRPAGSAGGGCQPTSST